MRMVIERRTALSRSCVHEEWLQDAVCDELGDFLCDHPEAWALTFALSANYPKALGAGTRTLRRCRARVIHATTRCQKSLHARSITYINAADASGPRYVRGEGTLGERNASYQRTKK